MQKCINCLENNGYIFIQSSDDIHATFYKFVDGNKFLLLLVGPHDGNNNGYILRGEFSACFDKWTNATYQRWLSSEEDFLDNWYKFWLLEELDDECEEEK